MVKSSFVNVTILCLCLVAATNCSLLQRENETEEIDSQFELLASFDKETYQQGEAGLCSITLINNGNRTVARSLNTSSLDFWVTSIDIGGTQKRRPVVSKKERLGGSEPIELDGVFNRTLVLTTITRQPGKYVIHIIYDPNPMGVKKKFAPVVSSLINFTVGEDIACERDRDGVLKKEWAIKIAKSQLPEGFTCETVESKLVINEGGFFDWWINLTDASGKIHSYFINPYLAEVRSKVKPFRIIEKSE